MVLKKLLIFALDSLAFFFFVPAYGLMWVVDWISCGADYLRGRWGIMRSARWYTKKLSKLFYE